MTTLNLTARELAAVVAPVLPMAGRDGDLPVINAVLIETDGKWLVAMSTDRFRIGIKRIEKRPTDDDPATEWPEFRALIPLRSVRSLLSMFKPTRSMNPELSLTVEGDNLIAEGAGGFDLFDASRFTYALQPGQFPDLRALVRNASEGVDERAHEAGINPIFMADFKACGNAVLRIAFGAPGRPIVLTDDEGFIGLLMPRKLVSGEAEDWSDFLAEKPVEKAPAKKAAPRKRAAKKATAA
jgi:DNA polymerase III sliding clamp (beta) subunit (PCNA family)